MRLLLVFLVLGLGVSPASAGPNGEKLYQRHCVVCHDEQGLGGIGLPLTGSKADDFTDDYLFKTIRYGRPGRVMPAFDFLSDAQVDAIVSYVKSWRGKGGQILETSRPITGNADTGADVFARACASCHGSDGRSEGVGTGVTLSRQRQFEVVPPALNNSGFLASASDAWIRRTIEHGRVGTVMPSKQALGLSDQDVNDVIAYLRSLQQQVKEQQELSDNEPPTLVFASPYDFDTTVVNLKESLKGSNFRYFPDRFLEQGLAPESLINKRQLSLRFCNFSMLYKMLNIDPRLGVILPCRVTVVEQASGEVAIYLMNMKTVATMFNNDQLLSFARQMHDVLLELIEEATM